MSAPLPRALAWIAAGLVLTALLVDVQLEYGLASPDDAWMLQVVERFDAGERVYEEIEYAVAPLSLWVTLPVTGVLGTNLVAFKALVSLVAVATALLAAWIAGRIGVGWGGQALIALAAISYLWLPTGTLYNPLAYLFLLATLGLVLAWQSTTPAQGRRLEPALLIAAGVAAGLCAASKQTIGAIALAALLVAVALYPPSRRPRRPLVGRVGPAMAGFVAGAALPLVPLALTGQLDDLIADNLNKGDYLRYASISYLDGVDRLGAAIADPIDLWRDLLQYSMYLIAPLALIALAIAWVQGERSRAATLGLFAMAAFVGVFPRADVAHVSPAVSVCALALGWSLTRIRLVVPRVAMAAIALTLTAVVVARSVDALVVYPAELGDLQSLQKSQLPHFGGTDVGPLFDQELTEMAARLRSGDPDGDGTFLLMPNAAMLYLSSGLENPTKYDYPTVNPLKGAGYSEVMSGIATGRIERVCVGRFDEPTFGALRPAGLIRYVRGHMTAGERIGAAAVNVPYGGCRLYRSKSVVEGPLAAAR